MRAVPSRRSTESSAMTTRSGASAGSVTHASSHDRYLGPNSGAGAAGALDPERPVQRLDAVGETPQSRPERRVGAADAVVPHLDHGAVAAPAQADLDGRRLGVLRDVRERLRD